MRGIPKSAYYFLWGIIKRIYIWGYALLLDPFDLFQKYLVPIIPKKYEVYINNMPSDWGLFAFILLMIWAAIMTYHEVRIKIEPSLQIDFHGRANTYFQEMPIILNPNTPEAIQGINQTYRVCVKNTGGKPIDNVQVKLISINPMPQNLYGIPLPLHFMNDNKRPYDRFRQIAKSQDEFIDIVSCLKGNNRIVVEHSVDLIPNTIEKNDYEIEILVTGNNVPELKRKFKIYVENEELFMNCIEA